ncbi:MAG TPA: c-type cytochrome [Candidatus Competibacteraceae bacterium]|nr:c-type cytochrome [Candidatus Competibacteraceae bacterium]
MKRSTLALAIPLLLWGTVSAAAGTNSGAEETIARGRYLVTIAGCNDCHTPGYAESAGKIPEAQWLTGSPVGFKGPWGVTYPSNLRLRVQAMNEEQWLYQARNVPLRPPMPWFNLRDMSDTDLKAIYHYLRHLGPAGAAAPAYTPPGVAAATPFILFVPQQE